MADVWQIKVNAVDRTDVIDVTTLRVTKTSGFRRDTATFALVDQVPGAITFQNWQTVEIYRNATLEFGGLVMAFDGQTTGVHQDNIVTCVDWSILLDARITDANRRFTSQYAGQIVATLVGEFAPEINTGVVVDGEMVGDVTYNYAILSDVIRDLAQASGFIYYVKVDAFGDPWLYFQAPTAPLAPFNLSTSPSAPTSYSFRVDNWATEGTELRNSITVQYADGTVTRENTTSQTTYGYELAMMKTAETADATLATIIADGLLEAYADELQSGTVTCWTGGLSAGQLIHVDHVPLGIDDDYIIQDITLIPDGDKTLYQLTLGDKHTGLIDRLRLLEGAGGGITSGGNITGRLFVGRREGPHVGLFYTKRPDLAYNAYLQAVDTGNAPFFNVGAVDFRTNENWLNIGYPDATTGKAPIRLAAATIANPGVEEHPRLEIDAAYLTGTMAAGMRNMTMVFYIPGTLAVGAQPMRLHVPNAATITNITAAVTTAPTGASLIVDVNKGGVTVFTTQANRPTITAGNTEDLSSVPDVTALALNDVLTLDIDAVGASVAGADLVVQVRCTI